MNVLLNSTYKVFQGLYRYGAAETLCRILHRLRIVSVKHSFHVFLKELEQSDFRDSHQLEKAAQIAGLPITMRELFEEELEKLEFADGMEPLKTLKEHFAYGSRFFCSLYGNMVIAIGEMNTQIAHLTYIRLPAVELPRNFVYLNSG